MTLPRRNFVSLSIPNITIGPDARSMPTYAFLSYQTADKSSAARVKAVLAEVKIKSFLAHEDIDVSEEWRLKILEEIRKVDLFVCLLSRQYLKSAWCLQESGIAVFRGAVPIVPLSLDGTTPPGFMSHLQSMKVAPEEISLDTLLPAFLKHDFPLAISLLIDKLRRAGSFRRAEEEFARILPYVPKMDDRQVKSLMECAAGNNQIHHASLCAREYIPALLKSHGYLLKRQTRSFLKRTCAQYA